MVQDIRQLTAEVGLIMKADFLGQKSFYFALLLAPVVLMFVWLVFPDMFRPMDVTWKMVLILVLWQPLIEELLFRGILQGQLARQVWFAKTFIGISKANLVVSLLFVAVHFFYHPPLWALAVLFPSLIFGWFRDCYRHIFPGVILHAFYNGCFLLFSLYLF